MLKVSIVSSSCRPGGMELLKMSLDRQTFRDFEVVFVDRYYELRRDILKDYFKDYNFIHVPPKRRIDYIDSGLSWNTGFSLASGELVCLAGDYTLYMSAWVQEHWNVHQEFDGKASLVGERTRVHRPPTKVDLNQPISIFKDELTPEKVMLLPVSRFEPYKIRKLKPLGDGRWECSFRSFLLSANESLPRELIMKINGLDESYNSEIVDGKEVYGGWGFQDEDVGLRAAATGHKFIFDPETSRPVRIEIKDLITPLVGDRQTRNILVTKERELRAGTLDPVCTRGIVESPFHFTVPAQDHWIEMQRILIISTQIYPCGGDMRYQGIERLAYYLGKGLLEKGAEVYVAAPDGSRFPKGITHVNTGPTGDFVEGELRGFGAYQHELGYFDAILDLSHSHQAMRQFILPAMCWCWHDPAAMQPPLPGYGVMALSEWQRNRLLAYQGVKARVFDIHMGVPLEIQPPSGRFLFIGRPVPNKGLLEAVQMCRELNVPLDIVGSLGLRDTTEYLDKVLLLCNDNLDKVKGFYNDKIIYWGNVSDDVKNMFLSRAQAVLHPLARGYEEANSHKSVDSCLAGCPVISYSTGAMPEVLEHGIDGYLAANPEEFKHYMLETDKLDRNLIQKRAIERWSIENVVNRLIPLLKELKRG